MTMHSLIPDPDVLLALEPEELAGVVLEYLNSLDPRSSGQLNRYNFSLSHTVEGHPPFYPECCITYAEVNRTSETLIHLGINSFYLPGMN